MSITYQPFTSLDGVNIDEFILSSIPYMDAGTYKWPEQCVDTQTKLAFIKNYIAELMSFPSFFGCSQAVDGYTTNYAFGFRIGGNYRALLFFTRPDANGSRAINYNPEAFAAWNDFLLSQGFTEYEGLVIKGSQTTKAVAVGGVTEYTDKEIGGKVVPTFTIKVE